MVLLVAFGRFLGPRSSEITSSRFHTSAVVLAQLRRKPKKSNGKPSSSSRTRLAKSLQPTNKAKRLGKLEVAPSPPAFRRDSVPHEGLPPLQREIPPRRRMTSESRSGGRSRPTNDPSDNESDVKHWAIKAHSERVDKRKAVARQPRTPQANPLEEEFDLSASAASSSKDLPTRFSSPPLMPGLLQSLRETLGEDARPTAIQSLSMKHLLKEPIEGEKYKEFLLASETGSGKSIAYLLPVLQDLKRTEHDHSSSNSPPSSTPLNPRALILAPTHELSRQLASFAKRLSHVIKLRIMCASKANTPSTARSSGTASKMKGKFEETGPSSDAEFVISKSSRASRPVDLLVGTPMKLLEMERGRGWNWEERARERAMRIGKAKTEEHEDIGEADQHNREPARKFWIDEPEMGLQNVEWVIVDEADVLLDPDFQESTRLLFADIAAARGQPVPVITSSSTVPSTLDSEGSPASVQPTSYPFNFLLTSATIPMSLATYLSSYHPSLTRLASPRLHHLPQTLHTEHTSWTGGNKGADIERRIRRVWAEDALVHAKSATGPGPVKLSKILVFCNKRSKVEHLAAFLDERGIKCVALTGDADARKRGSNHHLDGFLKTDEPVLSGPGSSDPTQTPHVLLTTSLLSRGLDFSPMIKHVFIVDEPRNMIDFLHRAGRAGRAGEEGKVVVFGRAKGRGSGRMAEVKQKVRALVG